MVWRLFAMKLETAETMEGVSLNRRSPYFYPTLTQFAINSSRYCGVEPWSAENAEDSA
jgi:hypothetical protein